MHQPIWSLLEVLCRNAIGVGQFTGGRSVLADKHISMLKSLVYGRLVNTKLSVSKAYSPNLAV